MSIDVDFRTAILAHAPLVALVDDRVSLNVVPDSDPMPLIAYSVRTDRVLGLGGDLHGDTASIEVQCWGETSASARSVADALIAALAAEAADNAVVVADSDTYDPDLKIHGQIVSVRWMT